MHLRFLFDAFDVWVDRPIAETFQDLFFAGGDVAGEAAKVRLFFRSDGSQSGAVNLFEACCRSYGESRGRARVFSLGQSLVLYAVVLHLIEGTPDFPRRVRIVRNLIEASSDELRLDRMPKILEDLHHIVRDGAVENVATLNQVQVEDEKLKATFIEEDPELLPVVIGLEDHEYLRGSLGAFEFDTEAFESRATSFQSVMSQPDLWPDLVGALLAVGEYQRHRTNARSFLFGTDSKRHDNAWRELLTGATRQRLQATRQVLASFLDLVASAPGTLDAALETIANAYLERCEEQTRFDWRYYMVKYPKMRGTGSSTYYSEPTDDMEQLAMGYSLCMLKAGGSVVSGNYRDPYLLAIWRELDDRDVAEDKWFSGYETQPRRLPLTQSGAALRCVRAGFELSPPMSDIHAEVFATVCADLEVDTDNVVAVPQVEVDGRLVDTVDRVQFGADIVRRLVAVGL